MQQRIDKAFPGVRWVLPGLIWLVLWSAIPEELDTLGVVDLGSIHVFLPDLMYLVLSIASISVLSRKKVAFGEIPTKIYLLFLVWLVFCTLRGFTIYGYRAFGEVRYAMPFFGFLFPFALFSHAEGNREEAIRTLLFSVVVIAGVTGLLMLVVEIIHGGRFFFTDAMRKELGVVADFRGIRYLGTTQTFNIMALAVLLLVRSGKRQTQRGLNVISAAILVGAALLTRNRAAIISVFAAGIGSLLLFKRFRDVAIIAALIAAGLFIADVNPQGGSLNIGASLLSSFSPEEDDTGSWRLLQNAAAIDKGMETPIAGEGFGGYFYLEVPGMPPIDAIIHNQFVLLFLKCGIISVLLCTGWLVWFLARFVRVAARGETHEEFSVWMAWLVVIALSQLFYGMAYPFTPLFGFYLGCGAMLLTGGPRVVAGTAENVAEPVAGTEGSAGDISRMKT